MIRKHIGDLICGMIAGIFTYILSFFYCKLPYADLSNFWDVLLNNTLVVCGICVGIISVLYKSNLVRKMMLRLSIMFFSFVGMFLLFAYLRGEAMFNELFKLNVTPFKENVSGLMFVIYTATFFGACIIAVIFKIVILAISKYIKMHKKNKSNAI